MGAVDDVALAVAARQRRKSWARLRHLVATSTRLAWAADRRLFTSNAALQFLGGVVAGVQVLITKSVLDAIISTQSGGHVSAAVAPVLALALVMAFSSASAALQQQLQRVLGELIARKTYEDVLDVSATVSLRSFESAEFYDQLQRVQANALLRPFTLTQGLIGLAGGLFGSIGLGVAIATLHPLLLPLLLLSGIPMFLATRRGSRLEFGFATSQVPKLRLREYLSRVQTGRTEAKEVRAFGLSTVLRRRYDEVYEAYLSALRRHVRRRTRLALLSSLSSSALLALTLLALIWLVTRGQVTLAQAGAAIVAVRLLSQQLGQLFGSVQQIFESGLFLEDLERFLTLGPVASEQDAGSPAPRTFDRLDVEALGFTYPGASSPALQDVSLGIGRGEVVALVGENGSGKTTLAKLLASLYDPDSGAVRWDGVDLREYQRASVRRAIAVIFQDFVRYQLSAAENIAFGRPDVDPAPDHLEQAAAQVGAHDFLARLPQGYDTLLSKEFAGGQDLSLGQWQRVALARAFYRDAPFVILDEPSASLDPRAEAELFSSLREMLDGRTVLYISHRMATVRDADRIYVLHEGRIVEHGSHDELMTAGGRYAELFNLQASAYLDSATVSGPAEPGGSAG